jgi:hypothetical protein
MAHKTFNLPCNGNYNEPNEKKAEELEKLLNDGYTIISNNVVFQSVGTIGITTHSSIVYILKKD